jgi:4-diphosphocytidyl-2-C-methyl-D-erythritol kinase
VGRKLPVQMKLEKRIPVGSGLGGGSSDAAAMLHAVNELFDLGVPRGELAAIAHSLGSDVPFLIFGGSAIVEGLGEKLTHHEQAPKLHAVIVLPEATCPTGEVYGVYDDIEPGPIRRDAVLALADAPGGSPDADGLFNDLTDAAVRTAPELADLLSGVSELAERQAHVSGSGSAIFVLCDDAVHAEYLAQAIEGRLDLPALPVQGAGQDLPQRGD